MGCGGSAMEKKIPLSWMELFASMRLSKSEVRKLYNIFKRVDLDGSGSVDMVELLTLLDIERTKFTEQVFTVFDSDGSGKVDFKEFVLAIWNYCTIGKASLDIFTFDMYDRDKSGKLSLEEVHQMLRDIYGKNHVNDPKIKAIEKDLAKIEEMSGITVDALKAFAKNHQNLLYPVFKLQHHLQEQVLGVSFWERASQRRIQLSKGKYVTLSDLMQLHMDQGLYQKVMRDSASLNPRAAALLSNTGTAQKRHGNDKSNASAPKPDHHPIESVILPPPGSGMPPPATGGLSHHPNNGHGHSGHDVRPGHDGSHKQQHGEHAADHHHHHHHHAGSGDHAHHSSKKDGLDHHHNNNHHKGAVLKNTASAAERPHAGSATHGIHASGHHYSDGKVHAAT